MLDRFRPSSVTENLTGRYYAISGYEILQYPSLTEDGLRVETSMTLNISLELVYYSPHVSYCEILPSVPSPNVIYSVSPTTIINIE